MGTVFQHKSDKNIIKDEERLFLKLCNLLQNRVAYKIIRSTTKQAKSAIEISNENRIPLSSTYKQIRLLEKAGLVEIEIRVLDNKNNSRIAYYRSKIRLLKIEMHENGINVQLVRNNNNKDNDDNIKELKEPRISLAF